MSSMHATLSVSEPVCVAVRKVRHDVVVGPMLEVRVTERAKHALDGDTGRIHREGVPFEPFQLVCIAHPFEGNVSIVLGRRRHGARRYTRRERPTT